MITALPTLIVGLVLLILGAEALVRGASRLARAMGISPLVVGLTVVAIGTSSPELAVGVQSAWSGQADIALGNIIGSNIFNILGILGFAAVITPLVVAQQIIRLDVPIMIGISLVVFLMAGDGVVSRMEAIALLGIILLYTLFLIRQSRREQAAVVAEYQAAFGDVAPPTRALWLGQGALLLAGIVLLVWGARLLVEAATAIAQAVGVSELVIGLTVVAAGTSLPELATSVVAALRKERDIAVGNVVGSNIINLTLVLGAVAMAAGEGVVVSPSILHFDLLFMIAVAFAALPIFFTGNYIARWEGWLFLVYYVVYSLSLILAASQHDALPLFSTILFEFVTPLIAITLLIVATRELRRRRARTPENEDVRG